jgi:hypothetical protein
MVPRGGDHFLSYFSILAGRWLKTTSSKLRALRGD